MAAEIVVGFIGPAFTVAEWLVAPITRQFNYLCCFSGNITSLKNEAKKLQVTEGDLLGKVDTARNDVRIISGEVVTWLKDSKDIKDETDGILNEVSNVESDGCLKFGARFSLSKRAKKTTDSMKVLRGECKTDTEAISRPRPPAATEVVPSERSYEFESRTQIEEDIITTLRGGDVNMIGICGMGGLGKTVMSKRIMNRALKEHIFEEVVMTVVGQNVNELGIQLEIATPLGLILGKEISKQVRVQKLHARLSGAKRILLVVDDVWERFALEDLGIPCDYKGCTILLTSRNRDVLSAMDVQKIFGMKVLSNEDSWFLFRERVGTCVDNTALNSIAKEVVNECKGLPIALTTVGAALKDDMAVSIWKDALRQLRQSDPDIPELISNVYNPLKVSYDHLGPKHKFVLLLCCLFAEDADIPVEHLTYFCMGLGIFEGGIRNVEEARNRICALTKMLKSRSLLLDSKNRDHVRMHDVVRDVCIFIARQEGYIDNNDCTWISSFHRSELPIGLGVPNLHLLFWARKYIEGEFTLDNSFLEGIRDLNVICIERYSLASLPHTAQMLRNLNTLLLYSCPRVVTLSVVGELVNLEILVCHGCDSIKELPPKIKGLNLLKVLELTECQNLQRIGRGIISSLVGLEELKMLGSFEKWEAEDREERENAGLRELEALTKLRCLEIDIEDPALAKENISLSSKVDRFTIRFSCERLFSNPFDKYLSKKKMRLEWDGATCLGQWIEMLLLRDIECLFLVGNGANNVEVAKLEKIRHLELGKCESMKNVVTTSMDDGGATATVFPSIEYLNLFQLPKLEEIWGCRISSNCFQTVKELKLDDLPALKQLWKSSQNDLGKDFLPHLEVLEIRSCEMMEQVFLWKGEDGNEKNSCHHITIMFPKLKELVLCYLPNLISFCQGIESIEFPLLVRMVIIGCEKMKGMVANGLTSNENNSGGRSNADIHHLFCQPQKVWFGCLKKLRTDRNPFCSHKIHESLLNELEELRISECRGSLSLFMSSIVRNLVNLRILEIHGCDEMIRVINDDEEKVVSGGQRVLLFPKLQQLQLWFLPKLLSFCDWKCDVELPSLRRRLHILRCPNMKNLTLPNLQSFKTDLNNYLLQVPLNSLKELSIYENEHPLNCYQIHVSLFKGLEVLTIFHYEGTMSLFSSSITENLVNLTRLTIEHCRKMVNVIEDEEEKEKVVSGVQRTLLFPKLQKLELDCLRELGSFCEWKCDVELPSLSEMEISNCDNMKSCTLGSLTTPNLKSVRINYDVAGPIKYLINGMTEQHFYSKKVCINYQDFGAVKDLNGALQKHYFSRAQKKQEEEADRELKKGGEEEQERKGEIEEEQN